MPVGGHQSTPDDITNFVPVSLTARFGLSAKNGLPGSGSPDTYKDTVKTGKIQTGIEIGSRCFPIDDVKTYEAFPKKENVGFSNTNRWMQKYMKDLKPDDGFWRFLICDERIGIVRTIGVYSRVSYEKKRGRRNRLMTLKAAKE
ncbi:hypothetical protein FQR65_LT19752 [Abscondita terminalis]|nr:hypothetical protein FQR65_LT19752 [Abscondita terminalis]